MLIYLGGEGLGGEIDHDSIASPSAVETVSEVTSNFRTVVSRTAVVPGLYRYSPDLQQDRKGHKRTQSTVWSCAYMQGGRSEPTADGGMKIFLFCSPLSLRVGYIKWSNVLCLVSCDDAQVHITTRPLGGGGREDG